MKKISLLSIAAIAIGFSASAQKVSTKVIDNKGTIKWVLDSSTAVITKADSTVLYVTPYQLSQSTIYNMQYGDTADMLAPYVNDAGNGLTKNGQTVELGGTLNKQTTIVTDATNFLAITGLQAGTSADSVMVVNPTTGQIKYVSAASLYTQLTYSNGLTKTGNDVKLGGALTEATTITTDATNVLKVAGLQSGDLSVDSLVVSSADGTLKRVSASTISLQSGDQDFAATTGQSTFAVTGMPATASKVWVFRNGAKLIANTDYTTAAGVVTLSAGMVSLIAADDAIEVQWVK
jgi:VCBS repeat-containing protein